MELSYSFSNVHKLTSNLIQYHPYSCGSKVYHYHIWENESSEYYMEEKYQFQTLEELIDYYKQHKGGMSLH